jgi:hypothetical protein
VTAWPDLPASVRQCVRCRQVRRCTALVPVAAGPDGQPCDSAGWRCARPCSPPGGRPPIGPPVTIRLPAELRAGVEALAEPGEKLAETVRRLLAAAVDAAAAPPPAAAPLVPAPLPPGYALASADLAGARGVLAHDRSGLPVVVGPVYSDKGTAGIADVISHLPAWTIAGTVRMVTRAHLDQHGDGMWRQ